MKVKQLTWKQLKNITKSLLLELKNDENLTNLKLAIPIDENNKNFESFVSGKDEEIVEASTSSIVENNKMLYTGAVLVNLQAVPVNEYDYQKLVTDFQTQIQTSFNEDVRVIYTNVYEKPIKNYFYSE